MDKDLVIRVLKNKCISAIIYQNIYSYHRRIRKLRDTVPTWVKATDHFNLLNYGSAFGSDTQIFNYDQLMERPFLMIRLGFLKQFKVYILRNAKYYKNNSMIISYMVHSIKFNKVHIFQYLVEDVLVDKRQVVINDFIAFHKDCFSESRSSTDLNDLIHIFKSFINLICNKHIPKSNGVAQAMMIAVKVGSLDIAKWLNSSQYEDFNLKTRSVTNKICEYAIISNNLELLDYLYSYDHFKKLFLQRHRLLEVAIENKQGPEIMKWITDRMMRYIENVNGLVVQMVRHSDKQTIEWIHRKFSRFNPKRLNAFDWLMNMATDAIGFGNIKVSAAKNNNIQLLEWIAANESKNKK